MTKCYYREEKRERIWERKSERAREIERERERKRQDDDEQKVMRNKRKEKKKKKETRLLCTKDKVKYFCSSLARTW